MYLRKWQPGTSDDQRGDAKLTYGFRYTISGLGLLYKPTGSSEKSLEFWNEAQRMLPSCKLTLCDPGVDSVAYELGI